MVRVEDDHMVEQIAAAAANPRLCISILPGASEAGPPLLDFETLQCVNDFAIEA